LSSKGKSTFPSNIADSSAKTFIVFPFPFPPSLFSTELPSRKEHNRSLTTFASYKPLPESINIAFNRVRLDVELGVVEEKYARKGCD
jgi:hypothetical protein